MAVRAPGDDWSQPYGLSLMVVLIRLIIFFHPDRAGLVDELQLKAILRLPPDWEASNWFSINMIYSMRLAGVD